MKSSPKNCFDFRMFMSLKPFFQTIYFGEVLTSAIERDQDVFGDMIEKLKKYKPRTKDNIKDKNNVLKNTQNLYDGREMIINAFKNKLFPLYSGNYYEDYKKNHQKVKVKIKNQKIKYLILVLLNKLRCWTNFTAQGGNLAVFGDSPESAAFKITDFKLYVPAVTLSAENENKLLEQLKTGFKGTINGINIDQKCLIRLKITI